MSTIFSGDDRYYNNIFLGYAEKEIKRDARYNFGLVGYNNAKLPVRIEGNIYYNEALPYSDESGYYVNPDFNPKVEITEEGDDVILTFSLDTGIDKVNTVFVTTTVLGEAKMPKEGFENPDGSPLRIDSDYCGNKRSGSKPSAGPFENPGKGFLKLQVW